MFEQTLFCTFYQLMYMLALLHTFCTHRHSQHAERILVNGRHSIYCSISAVYMTSYVYDQRFRYKGCTCIPLLGWRAIIYFKSAFLWSGSCVWLLQDLFWEYFKVSGRLYPIWPLTFHCWMPVWFRQFIFSVCEISAFAA